LKIISDGHYRKFFIVVGPRVALSFLSVSPFSVFPRSLVSLLALKAPFLFFALRSFHGKVFPLSFAGEM